MIAPAVTLALGSHEAPIAYCVYSGYYRKWEKNRHMREGRGVGEFMETGKRGRRSLEEKEEEREKGFC